jgi:hypothetical protein
MLQGKQMLGITQQQAQYLLLVYQQARPTLSMFGLKTLMVLDRNLLV